MAVMIVTPNEAKAVLNEISREAKRKQIREIGFQINALLKEAKDLGAFISMERSSDSHYFNSGGMSVDFVDTDGLFIKFIHND